MDAELRVAYQKLSVLKLAESLRNVSEAYRQRCVSGTQFYTYKRRFQTHDTEGLKNLPSITKSNPLTTQVAWIEKVNPCFRERHIENCRLGEVSSQDTLYVEVLKGVGHVYLHAVVDTYDS